MDASNNLQNYQPVETASALVSLNAFHGILWTGIVICMFTSAARVYIRYMCFRRLLLDDWVMLLALGMLFSVAALGQVYLKDIYMLMAVTKGEMIPGPKFPEEAQRGLRAFGVAMLFSYLGIYAIKLNFLLFFRRLVTKRTSYVIFWWAVLIITIACGTVSIGLMQFHCMFAPINYIMTVCPQYPILRQTYTFFKVSCIVDVASDVLIMCFPIVIVWKVRINLKKKIILFSIFSLVSFTIAATIVRGSIFGGVYKTLVERKRMNMNVTWIWFWFFIEYSVSFIIASLVSFRALFTQREKKACENKVRLQERASLDQRKRSSRKGVGFRRRAKWLHDSLLESFNTSETVNDMGLPIPASGTFSSTFIMDIEGEYPSRTELSR